MEINSCVNWLPVVDVMNTMYMGSLGATFLQRGVDDKRKDKWFEILGMKTPPSMGTMRMKHGWILHHGYDPKHIAQAMKEWLH